MDLDFDLDFDFDVVADLLDEDDADPVLLAIIAWKSAAVTLTTGRAAPGTGASGDSICIPLPAPAAVPPTPPPATAADVLEPANLDRAVLLLLDPGREVPLPPRLVGRDPAREPAREPLLPFRFGLRSGDGGRGAKK